MIDATAPTNTDSPPGTWFNGQPSSTTGNPTPAAGYGGLDGVSPRERAAALGIQWLEEAPETTSDAVASITADVAVRLRVVPIRFDQNRLVVAMVDPLDIAAADEVSTLTGKPITRIGLEQDVFSELMREHYGTTA